MRFIKIFLPSVLCILLAALAYPAFAVEGVYFTISGTVTDANWNPIYGADVELYDNYVDHVINTTKTDGNGEFVFENVTVKTNLCTVRVSYTEGGTTYKIPGYAILHYPATGVQRVDPRETHFDDYHIPGSRPRATPTPTPMPTATPTATPLPSQDPGISVTLGVLLFIGGFASGALIAAIACFIVMRRP